MAKVLIVMLKLPILLFTLSALVTPLSAVAGSISWTGNFAKDDDLEHFLFTLNSPSQITIRTFSYAGGTNTAGDLIPRGGFDPLVSIFTSAGDLIGMNNDGNCGVVAVDSVTGACWDSFLTTSLEAGIYRIVLSQSDNSASGPTLADGFFRDGQGNFTDPGGTGSFLDITGDQRSSGWALDLLFDDGSVSIPEPATAGIVSVVCLALFFLRSRLH